MQIILINQWILNYIIMLSKINIIGLLNRYLNN